MRLSKGFSEKFIRIFSLIIVHIFTFQILAWSAPALTLAMPGIQIPAGLGEIKDVFESSSNSGLFVHIQNAHGNYEAQKNIQKLIQHLVDHYGFKTLFLEGADEKVDPAHFRFFKDNRLNVKAADLLMHHGEFTGAEMFLLDQGRAEAYGIEDAKTYQKDFELFQQVLKSGNEPKKFLDDLKSGISVQESRIFSKALRDFVREWRLLHDSPANLLRYVRVLHAQAVNTLSLNLADPRHQDEYEAMLRVLKLAELEKKLNIEKALKEKETILRLAPRLQNIEKEKYPRFVLEKVYEQAGDKAVDFRKYPNFTLYAEYLIFQSEITSKKLFEEAETLTRKIFDTLAKTPEEKKLIDQIHDVMLLEKLLTLELTPGEWREIKLRMTNNEFRMKDFMNLNSTFDIRNSAFEFYRLAQEREKHFLENSLKRMKKLNQSRVILVTGGFHSEGMAEKIKAKGLSYILISPNIENAGTGRDIYRQAMMGKTKIFEHSEIEKLLQLKRAQTPTGIAEALPAVRIVLEQAGLPGEAVTDLTDRIESGERNIVFRETVSLGSAASLGSRTNRFVWAATLSAFLIPFASAAMIGCGGKSGGHGGGIAPVNTTTPPPTNAPYRFAPNFSTQELVTDASKRTDFVRQFLTYESAFHQPGIGYNGTSGLTYEGHPINFDTGELTGGPRTFSAASKESLQVSILALAISGNTDAQFFVSPTNPSQSESIALDILTKKITSYEQFNTAFPGFGGFLPFFNVTDQGLTPAANSTDHVPSLDNGQLAWSLYVAYNVLQDRGQTALAARFKAYFDRMARNAITVFYEGNGRIRGEARINNNQQANPVPGNYSQYTPGYFLNDPYEGEMFAYFMILFADWTGAGLNAAAEADNILIFKRQNLRAIDYDTGQGIVTAQRGFVASAHEQWGLMVLPYLRDPLARQVFENTEKARQAYSVQRNVAGFYSAAHRPVTGSGQTLVYENRYGVPDIASQSGLALDAVTPYGAFPSIMVAPPGVGLAWLDLMLDANRAQGPRGTTESIFVNGTGAASILTWDAKMTTVLAVLGGTVTQSETYLTRDGKSPLFIGYVSREYGLAFPGIKGAGVSFLKPPATLAIPKTIADFQSSTTPPPAPGGPVADKIVTKVGFRSGGSIVYTHNASASSLTFQPSSGYIFGNMPEQVDLAANPFIVMKVRTTAPGTIFLELQTSSGVAIVGNTLFNNTPKVLVPLPDTGGNVQEVKINLTSEFRSGVSNRTAGIVAFSDPALGTIEFTSIGFSANSLGDEVSPSTEASFDRSESGMIKLALKHEEGGITEGVLYIPENPGMLQTLMRRLGLKNSGPEDSRQIRLGAWAINHDAGLAVLREKTGLRAAENSDQGLPLILFEGIITTKSKQESRDLARELANAIRPGDMLIHAGDQSLPHPVIDRLKSLQHAKRFRVRTVEKELVSRETIQSMTRSFNREPVSISRLRDTEDLKLEFKNGLVIKLNQKELDKAGIHPVKIVELVRAIADNPDSRIEDFLKYGFTPQKGFLEAGASLADALDDIYRDQIGRLRSAQSA